MFVPPVCRLRGVRRSFVLQGRTLPVLRDVDLDVEKGDRVAVTGPSGAGKSTLLSILGLIDDGFEGEYSFFGRNVRMASQREKASWRLARLGFAFQDLHLVPSLSAEENVALPAVARGEEEAAARRRANELLARAGLNERLGHRPSELSGGEKRRVALARALVNKPDLILADEPTGELDEASAEGVFRLLDLAGGEGAALVVVTHDAALLARFPRRVTLEAGQLKGGVG